MAPTTDSQHPANRLIQETSPYLLQHAHNPVDWYPWCDEAFQKAEAEDKPIFLSVGYSSCHWCHVMERESFENERIAALLNEHFVSIKVDREERPDVDQIYMNAVQAFTGHGGWPMSVFLTPEGRPFWGGTYFPPTDARGMPGFDRVLLGVSNAWTSKREEIESSSKQLTEQLEGACRPPKSEGALDDDLIRNAVRQLERAFDPVNGGFGPAPKFPHPMDLRLLLRHHARTNDDHALHMARHALDKMARGGIHDHLGGGFARYSTDERWLVPHFEKMLYDNALLGSAYVEAFQLTGDPELAQVARGIFDYVLGRMTAPEGGFYSAEDADSEGEEGKYYVWTLEEIRSVLGPERAEVFAAVYDVTAEGNWEGKTILNLPKPIDQAAQALGSQVDDLRRQLAEDRAALLEARQRREPPFKDTKVLAAWNGLMIAALARGARAFDEPRYLQAATAAARFVLERMRAEDGRLLRSWKDGQAKHHAYLDDYANMIDGLTNLYEMTGDPAWLRGALELADGMTERFQDAEEGGFFYTARDHEALISRTKDAIDNATPSGNAMAATALARLAALTGRDNLEDRAWETLRTVRAVMERAPTAAAQSLIALDFLTGGRREIVVLEGDDPDEFRSVMSRLAAHFEPRAVVAPRPARAEGADALVPLFEGRTALEGRTTIFVCERGTCKQPVGPDQLDEALGA